MAPDTIRPLADLVGAQISAIAPTPDQVEQTDPIRQFGRTQRKLKTKRFSSLYIWGQRECRVELVGEWLPAAPNPNRYNRALRINVLNARFSAGMANDIGLHMSPAELITLLPGVSAPTIRRELQLLVTRGLILLVSDPSDNRRKLIFPTQKFMHLFFRTTLTKLVLRYGLVYGSDRLAAATFHTRWCQDFQFDPEILNIGRELVNKTSTFSRVVQVDAKEDVALFC